MSVAAERSRSPKHFGSKRLFEPSESSSDFQRPASSVKRARRRSGGSPAHREHSQHEPGALRASYLAALQGLFPNMEEKTLSDILDTCGDNIDAAIKRLGELQLTAQCTGAAQKLEHPSVAALRGAEPGQANSSSGSPKGADAASSGHQTPPEPALGGGGGAGAAGGVPSTSAEWVEALVQQMAGAADVGEARARAAGVLRAFEQAVLQKAGHPLQGGGGGGESAALRAQLAELARDNGILKRAVAIQNARLQETAGARDAEVAALRGALAQYEARIRALELSNYSLGLHLRQATGAAAGPDPLNRRPPDVY